MAKKPSKPSKHTKASRLSTKVAAWVHELRTAEPALGPDALAVRINERLAIDEPRGLQPVAIFPRMPGPSRMNADRP